MLDCIQTFYLLHSVPEATSTNVIWNMHFKSTKSPSQKKKSPNLICLATRENGTHICQTCKWRKSTVGTKINSTALYKGLKSVKLCDWKLRLLCNTEWIHHVGHTDMYLSRAVQFLLYVEIKKGCAENPFPYPVIKGYLHNQSDPFFKVNEIFTVGKT